jgi:antirestriction protein ArdC
MSKDAVYESVTERILAELEAGVVPWRKPWVGGGPINVRNGRAYRGINVFLLALQARSDPRWGTYNAMREAAVRQAIKEGREIVTETTTVRGRQRVVVSEVVNGVRQRFDGGVDRGEKGTSIILWKPVTKRSKQEQGEDSDERYLLLKSYTVFNAEQAVGLAPWEPREYANDPIERAQEIIDGYTGPSISYGGSRASYSMMADKVECPSLPQFESSEAFYSTMFHELTHSTGIESRLGRDMSGFFASIPYSKEELCAEMGAAMLCGVAGIDNLDQSAAYVGNWLERLRDDRKLVVQAAAQAQRAADYILGTTFEDGQEASQLALTV